MAQLTTIIVHGTWARTADWWQETPGANNFWAYIKAQTSTLYGGPDAYSWSGANQHVDRVVAASDLVDWCASHGVERLQAIAHSHGVNVCLLASRLGLEFENLIALACPVRIDYLPDMRIIAALHNIYSEFDLVQTPAATLGARRGEGRTLADTDVLVNYHVPYFSKTSTQSSVGHSDLHDPSVWTNHGLDSLVIAS